MGHVVFELLTIENYFQTPNKQTSDVISHLAKK